MNIRSIVMETPALRAGLRPFYSVYKKVIRAPFIARQTIMDRESLLAFWQTPEPEGNVPTAYVQEDALPRSKALLELIRHLPKESRILEVGCNAGRNLAYLHNAGYRNVEGVEISPHAVGLLRETYPELADTHIHLGAAEDVLPGFGDTSFDLVFTMAVMEHIHPQSIAVFDNIARIGRRVLAIEPMEGHTTSRQFPHNLEKIFTSRGFRLKSKTPLPHVKGIETYCAWIFRR